MKIVTHPLISNDIKKNMIFEKWEKSMSRLVSMGEGGDRRWNVLRYPA